MESALFDPGNSVGCVQRAHTFSLRDGGYFVLGLCLPFDKDQHLRWN